VPSVAGTMGKFSEIGCGEEASRDGRRIKGSIATILQRAGKVHLHESARNVTLSSMDPSILIISFCPAGDPARAGLDLAGFHGLQRG